MSTTGWVVLGIVVFVIWAISIYNSLVAMRQRTNQAFANIDVQLKQRHDLIPNLVETVKGYATRPGEPPAGLGCQSDGPWGPHRG
jgi:LemA protein